MKKIILLVISIFILTGCSAEYNLIYENNIFKENFKVISPKEDNFVNNININYDRNYFVNYKLEFGDMSEIDYISKYGGIYDKKIIDENNNYGLELKYDYEKNDKNFLNSSIVHNLFEEFYVSDTSIRATKIKNIFENYDNLNEIKIVFTTDKKVVNTNYDEEKDGKYYWYINKNNYKDKSINIYLSDDEDSLLTNEGYLNGNIIKYILMILIIIILLSIVVIYEKVKKSNN